MYNITKDPASGSYLFQTENGLAYLCQLRNCTRYLSPVLGIYDIEIYEFDFSCYNPAEQPPGLTKFDKKISATISDLLMQFFTNELRVIIYVCDTSDGKHKERQRLFRN